MDLKYELAFWQYELAFWQERFCSTNFTCIFAGKEPAALIINLHIFGKRSAVQLHFNVSSEKDFRTKHPVFSKKNPKQTSILSEKI